MLWSHPVPHRVVDPASARCIRHGRKSSYQPAQAEAFPTVLHNDSVLYLFHPNHRVPAEDDDDVPVRLAGRDVP